MKKWKTSKHMESALTFLLHTPGALSSRVHVTRSRSKDLASNFSQDIGSTKLTNFAMILQLSYLPFWGQLWLWIFPWLLPSLWPWVYQNYWERLRHFQTLASFPWGTMKWGAGMVDIVGTVELYAYIHDNLLVSYSWNKTLPPHQQWIHVDVGFSAGHKELLDLGFLRP